MTKFASANDPGFIRVRDQLWLWTEAIRVKNTSIREKKAEHSMGTELKDRAYQPNNVKSGGGPLFMGNLRLCSSGVLQSVDPWFVSNLRTSICMIVSPPVDLAAGPT